MHKRGFWAIRRQLEDREPVRMGYGFSGMLPHAIPLNLKAEPGRCWAYMNLKARARAGGIGGFFA